MWRRTGPGRLTGIGEYDNGQTTTLASASVSESYNQWYDVRILTEGDAVTVWRGPKGGAMEQVVQCSGVGYTDSDRLWFQTNYWATYDLDDIVVVGGSMGATTTTFTYTDANELATQTVNGVTTAFTYDAWGRMVEKAVQGGPSATYEYRYGDKLYSVASTFPGEGTVTFQYGGDEKRRSRTAGGVTTKYRWDAGWNLLNEETAAGVLTRTFYGARQAYVDGSDPSSGAWHYLLHDHLMSVRGVYDGAKSALAEYEYSPYGGVFVHSCSSEFDDSLGEMRVFSTHTWEQNAGLYIGIEGNYDASSGHWNGRYPYADPVVSNLHGYKGGLPVETNPREYEREGAWTLITGCVFTVNATRHYLTDSHAPNYMWIPSYIRGELWNSAEFRTKRNLHTNHTLRKVGQLAAAKCAEEGKTSGWVDVSGHHYSQHKYDFNDDHALWVFGEGYFYMRTAFTAHINCATGEGSWTPAAHYWVQDWFSDPFSFAPPDKAPPKGDIPWLTTPFRMLAHWYVCSEQPALVPLE